MKLQPVEWYQFCGTEGRTKIQAPEEETPRRCGNGEALMISVFQNCPELSFQKDMVLVQLFCVECRHRSMKTGKGT